MSAFIAHLPCSRTLNARSSAFKTRTQDTSNIEKWDVVMWNDDVHSARLPDLQDHHSSPSSSRSPSPELFPCSPPQADSDSILVDSPQPLALLPRTKATSFASTASAFGFGCLPTKLRSVPRPIPSPSPIAETPQTRLDALVSLHRAVQENDADFLTRMREYEQQTHSSPNSPSVLRSDDLTQSTRGRKRGYAGDEDGDVEMNCWNERRRRRFAARSCSRLSLGSSAPSTDGGYHQNERGASGIDEFILPDHEADDSHSSEDEDDDLDVVVVGGSSVPSLLNPGSTPPSLSTSLSSLPMHSGDKHIDLHDHTTPPATFDTKNLDELSIAMAGGAGSIVEWCTLPDTDDADDAIEAGALWA